MRKNATSYVTKKVNHLPERMSQNMSKYGSEEKICRKKIKKYVPLNKRSFVGKYQMMSHKECQEICPKKNSDDMSDGVPINLCEADKKDFGEKNVKKKLEEMTARVSTDMCEECRKICQKKC